MHALFFHGQIDEKKVAWLKAGGGAKAAAKVHSGKHLLPTWKGDHSDWCRVCDDGGNLLCCDFCSLVRELRLRVVVGFI